MLYQDHSHFMSFWKQVIDEFDTQAVLTPLVLNSFMRTYESGEFDVCQQKITTWISDQKQYNAYLLLLSIACALLSPDSKNNLLTQLKAIVDILYTVDAKNKENQKNQDKEGEEKKVIKIKKTLYLGNSLTSICRLIMDNLLIRLKELSPLSDVESFNLAIKDIHQLAQILTDWSSANLLQDKQYLTSIEQLKKWQNQAKKMQTDESYTHSVNTTYEKQAEQATQGEKIKDTLENHIESIPVQSTKNTDVQSDGMLHKFASIQWYQLIKKIHLLKQLVKDERIFEAAIIYQDIEQSLTSFDPKVYFPGLFFDLFKQISPKISEIYRFTTLHQQSLQWHMAERLYHTDMERFVRELGTFVANQQSDEDFTEYQALDRNPSDENNTRLVDPQYAMQESKSLYFKPIQNNIKADSFEDIQAQINQYENMLQQDTQAYIDEAEDELNTGNE